MVAAGPGGGSDQLARTVQSIIQKYKLVDRSVIVTNKGGGSGTEAFIYAKGAIGNPHKVVFATNNVWLIPLGSAVGYRWSDLQPVAAVAFDEFMLWVNSNAPYSDVSTFLNAARSGTKRLAVAGTASKDTDQVLVRQIEKVGQVAFSYVPFRSGSEVAVQLAGGHVAANVNNPQENAPLWRAGSIRPLCVFSPARLAYADVVSAGQHVGGHPDVQGSGAANRALPDAADSVAAQGRDRGAGGVLSECTREGSRDGGVESLAPPWVTDGCVPERARADGLHCHGRALASRPVRRGWLARRLIELLKLPDVSGGP